MIKLSIFLAAVFLSISVCLISCSGDSAQDTDTRWKYLGDMYPEQGAVVSVYLDLDSIEVNDNTRKFFIKYVQRKADDENDPGYIRQLGYWEVDCFDRKLFRLREEFYSPSSKLINATEGREEDKYTNDDSLGAKVSYAVCRYAGR